MPASVVKTSSFAPSCDASKILDVTPMTDVASIRETSKFNFCGPSLTKSNYIVCDFCRSLTELSGLSI